MSISTFQQPRPSRGLGDVSIRKSQHLHQGSTFLLDRSSSDQGKLVGSTRGASGLFANLVLIRRVNAPYEEYLLSSMKVLKTCSRYILLDRDESCFREGAAFAPPRPFSCRRVGLVVFPFRRCRMS